MASASEACAHHVGEGARRPRLATTVWGAAAAAAVVAGLLLLPYLDVPLYYIRFLSSIFLYITLAQSWNIIGGYTGYVSFGHVTFFGIGAYIAALLYRHVDAGPQVAAIPSGLVAALFGMLIGYPALRLRGPYFGIATLALSLVVMLAFANAPFAGGGEGIVVRGGLPFTRVALEQAFYFGYLALALLSVATAWWLERSKFGFGLRAIRDDEDVALSVGVNATRLKVLAFGLSSFFPGAVGAWYAHQASYVSPADVFTLSISFKSLVYAVVGGTGTVLGPVVGAVFMEVFNTLLTISALGTQQVDRIVFGVLLIVVILAAPSGIVGLFGRFPRAVRRRT
jgi:branched-chain amino acid transport system permease protein